MRETKRSTQEILQDMLSGNPERIRCGSNDICSLSQNHHRIMELVPYTAQIRGSVKSVLLGSGRRHFEDAIMTLRLHEENKNCPCCLLYGEGPNPQDLLDDGYFSLLECTPLPESPNYNHYRLRCKRCGMVFTIEELEYHFTWWNWNPIGKKE